MMFLEFFIWGGWFVSLGTFLNKNLNATDAEAAGVFSTQSWGAIIAPFIIGLIADRFFNAEKILGVLHLMGAVLMYKLFTADHVASFYPYVLIYMIGYMPTIALANSVAFNQMTNPDKEFSPIRVWGTIGWILAGLLISYLFKWDSQQNIAKGFLKYTFLMSGIASLLLGLLSFTLPKTPPKQSSSDKVDVKKLLGLDALKLLRDRNFAIFFIASVLICIPLAFYYQITNDFLSSMGMDDPTGKMTIGQVSEVLFLLLLPFFFKRFGFKWTILIGMLAWTIRYLLFAFGNGQEGLSLLLIGIALHGICYDFFFVSGYIYTDSKAGKEFKSAAQGLITLATYGVGMLIGFRIAGWVKNMYKISDSLYDYKMVWLIPAGIAAVVFVLFSLLFNEKTRKI